MKEFKYVKTFEQFDNKEDQVNEAISAKQFKEWAVKVQSKPALSTKLLSKAYSTQMGMNRKLRDNLLGAFKNTTPEEAIKILNGLSAEAEKAGGSLTNTKAKIDVKTGKLIPYMPSGPELGGGDATL